MTDAALLLPPSTTHLERAAATASATVDALPAPLRELWDPATCPVDVLPWLAYAFGVEEWNPDWPEDQRRTVIDQSIPIKRNRGTIGAVRRALVVLGVSSRVQEWFNQVPQGVPYTYRLHLDVRQSGFSQSQLAEALQAVERSKNLRSHVDTITVGISSGDGVFKGVLHTSGHDLSVLDGTTKYSDGTPALDLLIDGALNGEAALIAAIDALHHCMHVTMPAQNP